MIRYVQRMLRHRKVNSATRRLVADRSGSALVEFAFVIAPTLALVFGIIQTMLLFFVSQIVETATERAGRLLLTNRYNRRPSQSRTKTPAEILFQPPEARPLPKQISGPS